MAKIQCYRLLSMDGTKCCCIDKKYMERKYSEYSVEDFLHDEDFLSWRLIPSDETDAYWSDVIKEYPEKEVSINQAIQILRTITINKGMLSQEDEDAILLATQERYRSYRKRRILWLYAGAAACIALLCVIPFFQQSTKIQPTDVLVEATGIQADTMQSVQLILGTNEKITMPEDADIQWSKKDEIQITGRKTKSAVVSKLDRDVVSNQLIVPKGKRSFLTLPDGTKVWVNSGTKVSFPSEMEGAERTIQVDGEIYIEVARNEEKPFYVCTSDFKVKVHGTKFNVMAYKGDETKSVVLVDGRVSVLVEDQAVFLNPDQMYKMDKRGVDVYEVDAYKYVSWKDGVLQFTSERLSEIALRLSRYYGVNINCEEEAAQKSCTGKLVLFDNMENTLKTLSNIFPVRYEIQDNKIKISMNP